MIQRIQSLYILIVIILQSVLLSSNFAKYIDPTGVEVICKTRDFLTMAILTLITALVPAISLFLYKKRMLQIRFNIFNAILLAALQGFVIYYIMKFYGNVPTFKFSIPSVFPLISIIFTILAIRNILRDELLIKSLNRIR